MRSVEGRVRLPISTVKSKLGHRCQSVQNRLTSLQLRSFSCKIKLPLDHSMEISTRLEAVSRNMSVAGLLLAALLALPFGLVTCKHRGNREIEDPQAFGPPCRTYHSSKCALIHKTGAPTEPFCHPGNASQHACTFDTSALITCPLSPGRYGLHHLPIFRGKAQDGLHNLYLARTGHASGCAG